MLFIARRNVEGGIVNMRSDNRVREMGTVLVRARCSIINI